MDKEIKEPSANQMPLHIRSNFTKAKPFLGKYSHVCKNLLNSRHKVKPIYATKKIYPMVVFDQFTIFF